MNERARRKAAEREVDDLLLSQGRDPKLFLNDSERSQAMAHAMRWAAIAGTGAFVILFAAEAIVRVSEGAWRSEFWDQMLLVPPVVFVVAFFYKRGKLIERAAALWAPKREQMVADTLERSKADKANEIDAQDVLLQYGRVLAQRGNVVRDSAELPYPKAAIKLVIEHCLKIGGDAETVAMLQGVYVGLADFQPLTNAEKQAISVWERLPESSRLSDQETRSLAGTLNSHGDVYLALSARCEEERQTLMRAVHS